MGYKTRKIYKSGLTQTQYGIYMECINNPDRTTYNLPFLHYLKSQTDVEKLKKVLERLLEIHPGINSRLEMNENGEIFLCGNAMTEEDHRTNGRGICRKKKGTCTSF